MAATVDETAARPKNDRFTVVLFVLMCIVWLALTLHAHFDHGAATPAIRTHATHATSGALKASEPRQVNTQ